MYGEPHAQTVLDAWGKVHADFHRVIADLGYLVVSIDNRGTPAPKGAAWRRAIFGSLGPLSTEEQAAALKELARTRPYVDSSRVGNLGLERRRLEHAERDVPQAGRLSRGHRRRAQAAAASLQRVVSGDLHADARDNPEGYRRAAPINFAEGLKGDLLIIHGTGETNTHLQITEGLVDRLIELGKRFDYMAYPHRDHGLREGRGTAVHLRMLMARYLIEHLPPGPR